MAANDTVQDFALAHQIDLVRVGDGVAEELIRDVFNQTDERLIAILQAAEPGQDVSREVEAAIAAQAPLVAARWDAHLREVVDSELATQRELLERVLGPLGVGAAAGALTAALARARNNPADGLTPAEWLAAANRGDRERAARVARAGAAANRTPAEQVRAVVGSVALRRRDGVREVARRGIRQAMQALTGHAAAQSAVVAWEANAQVVKSVRWISTLDGKTCPICGSLDGTIFPVRQGIRPPAHTGCRCAVVPIIPRLEAIGGAPGRDVLPANVVDRFDGQPPRVLRYEEWLRERSPRFQREVLGPARFKLWSEGEISLERFVNDRNSLLTLDELRRKIPATFEEVGL